MTMLRAFLGESLATKIGPWSVSQTPGILWSRNTSSAGIAVDEEKALSLSAVFAAANFLSSVKGQLPIRVYQKTASGKEQATTHRAYRLLDVQPNREMTASTFHQTLDFHRLMWGNCYAEIQWDGGGNPVALWPIEPWRVRAERDDNDDLYWMVDSRRRVSPYDMIHVPLISMDGVCGRSFVEYASDSLGLGLAAQEFAAKYFANDARPGGLLEHPGAPPKPARDEMKNAWNQQHAGSSRSNVLGLLWGGWKWNQAAGSTVPEEAQLLETRKFTTEEVARWFNIPPHLLAELSRATFSNIEEQGLNLIVYTLGSTLVRYEQEYDAKLLNPPALYSKHNVNALVRGNMEQRSKFYREMFGIGSMTINKILELEDENPIGELGDLRFVPVNMMTLERAAITPEEETDDPEQSKAPDANAPAVKGGAGEVQAQALNGAQVTSLLTIVQSVAAGQLPSASAKSMILAAFPLIAPEMVNSIIDPLNVFEPREQEPAPMPSQSQAPPEDQPPEEMGRIRMSHRNLLRALVTQLAKREASAATRAAERPAKFQAWMDTFYADHGRLSSELLAPAFLAWFAVSPTAQPPDAAAAQLVSESQRAAKDSLLATSECSPSELVARVAACVAQWPEQRLASLEAYLT